MLLCTPWCVGAEAQVSGHFGMETIGALPRPLSGHFAGVHNHALICAGGSDFDVSPWQGGEKQWFGKIYVKPSIPAEWIEAGDFAQPLAYGAMGSTASGVVCAGGSDGIQNYAASTWLRWDGAQLTQTALPDLPAPCAMMGSTVLNDVLYVAGGQSTPDATAALHSFWRIDLKAANPQWETLEPWPGPARILPVMAANAGFVFLFSGADLHADETGAVKRNYLRDAYAYQPGKGWRQRADLPQAVVAGSGIGYGVAHVFVFSGDDGSLVERNAELGDNHPGFPKDILAYHSITNTWAKMGEMAAPYVTTSAVLWDKRIVIPGGEDRPGHRGGDLWSYSIIPAATHGLFALDYAMMLIYFAVLVFTGVYFSRREKTSDDFFLGGKRVPWWAAGISIYGTVLSAITFLSVPATAFSTDWVYFVGAVTILLMGPLVVYVYLPFFRRLNITSAYEYLELRFNLAARLFGSASFVFFQLGRVGIVLFLPALALSAASGLDIRLSIICMGVLCTIYTVLGGIEAVIWTDVLQVVVLLGGAILCLATVVGSVEGGFGAVWSTAIADDKFRLANWTWDYTAAAFWVVCLGRTLENVIPYTTDQTVVQRYLTTSTEKEAARSVWLGTIISFPSAFIFFGLGTALYAYYKMHPEGLDPSIQNDAIVPLFVVQNLPAGVSGLIIAAVFAASMSSMDSSLNSVATVVVTDFYRRFRSGVTETAALRLARWITVALGIIGTGGALLLAGFEVKSLWEYYMMLIGLFGGGLAGLFALGIFSRRATGTGALIGAGVAAFVLTLVQYYQPVSFLLYSSIGIVCCMVCGYLASLVLPASPKDLAGLTWYTLNDTKSPKT